MSLQLTVTQRLADGGEDGREATVLEAVGTVDVYTAPCLKAKVQEQLREERVHLVIDLCHVDYLDSTGLGVILGAMKRARAQNGNLVLVASNPKIRRIFEITGLNKIVSVFERLDEAVRFVAGPVVAPATETPVTVGAVS